MILVAGTLVAGTLVAGTLVAGTLLLQGIGFEFYAITWEETH